MYVESTYSITNNLNNSAWNCFLYNNLDVFVLVCTCFLKVLYLFYYGNFIWVWIIIFFFNAVHLVWRTINKNTCHLKWIEGNCVTLVATPFCSNQTCYQFTLVSGVMHLWCLLNEAFSFPAVRPVFVVLGVISERRFNKPSSSINSEFTCFEREQLQVFSPERLFNIIITKQ